MHAPGSGTAWARVALAVTFAALAAVFTISPTAQGATPASGTLTDTSGPINYTAGPFPLANPTPVPLVDSGPECENPVQPCDDFALTVTLPSDYAETHPNDVIRFTMGWTDTGTGQSIEGAGQRLNFGGVEGRLRHVLIGAHIFV